MAVRVANEWLSTCGGCEVTILDLGEALLDLLPALEFVHMPVLMDHKYFGQLGERSALEIPEADVGLVSGSIRNAENREIAEEMRRKCKTIVAVGSCANYGGIPALANMGTTEDLFATVYRDTPSTEASDTPSAGLPPLEDRVYSVSEVIDVDVALPGCPTTPELIAEALTALVEGREFTIPERSVCDDCPVKREKKAVSTLRRPLEAMEFEPGAPMEETRCFMEQGYLCLGPVTRSGCGGAEGTPRCVKAYQTCRGCFGPVRDSAKPMIDMMGALSSVGLDARQIQDRRGTFNRFIGSFAKLRPVRARARR